MNQNQQYGARTSQHTQARQQADLLADMFSMCTRMVEQLDPPPSRIDAYLGCAHPATEDWLRETIDATFAHPDRVQIETWSFPAEDEIGRASCRERVSVVV